MKTRVALVAALAWSAVAQAQKPAQSPPDNGLALEAARRSATELGCTAQQSGPAGRTEIAADASGIASSMLHFAFPGCARQNVLVIQATGQPLRAMAMLPGTTAADPVLQRDAIRPALSLAAARLPNCQSVRFTDTRVTVPGEVAQGRVVSAWREEWVATGCGATTRIQVTLTPSARGGTDYSLRPAP